MFSSSRIPFVVLSLLLASASLVEAHDFDHQQRDHVNLKRFVKKRSPVPADSDGGLLGPILGAAPVPSITTSTSAIATSASVSASTTASASASASSSASVSASASASSASTSASVSASSSASTTSSSAVAPSSTTSEGLNLTNAPGPAVGVSTIIGTVTSTSTSGPSDTSVPDVQSNAADNTTHTKSMTLTILIAIAASVGGIAIIWTIFRKWKLSSSKDFDRRLNPIDWQPTTGEEDGLPVRRRTSNASNGSGRTGAAGGYATSNNGHGSANPFDDFDSPATNSAPVGGYADLSRGPSPTEMQEHLTRGPSVNRGYDAPIPIHHQAYGQEAYSGAGARY